MKQFEFTLDPKITKTGDLVGMHVQIATDGDTVTIRGKGDDGEMYEADLVLRRITAGGDHCWVCRPGKACEWVEPCPK